MTYNQQRRRYTVVIQDFSDSIEKKYSKQNEFITSKTFLDFGKSKTEYSNQKTHTPCIFLCFERSHGQTACSIHLESLFFFSCTISVRPFIRRRITGNTSRLGRLRCTGVRHASTEVNKLIRRCGLATRHRRIGPEFSPPSL